MFRVITYWRFIFMLFWLAKTKIRTASVVNAYVNSALNFDLFRTDYHGGTCWLKKGSASKDFAVYKRDSVCGLAPPPTTTSTGLTSSLDVVYNSIIPRLSKIYHPVSKALTIRVPVFLLVLLIFHKLWTPAHVI
jgi:hypothetical protein